MSRLLHPIPEAADVLGGMSRSTLYERIASGEIAAVKVGRRTYIAHGELERYVRVLTGSLAIDLRGDDEHKVDRLIQQSADTPQPAA